MLRGARIGHETEKQGIELWEIPREGERQDGSLLLPLQENPTRRGRSAGPAFAVFQIQASLLARVIHHVTPSQL